MARERPILHARDHQHGGADPVGIAWEDIGSPGGAGALFWPIANQAAGAIDSTTYPNSWDGAGNYETIVMTLPTGAAILAAALNGDAYPRMVMTASPLPGKLLMLGEGSFDPTTGLNAGIAGMETHGAGKQGLLLFAYGQDVMGTGIPLHGANAQPFFYGGVALELEQGSGSPSYVQLHAVRGGAPTIGGNVGDLCIRQDGNPATSTYLYECTTAGAAGAAVWTAVATSGGVGGGGGTTEYDYVARSTDLTVTATTAAGAQAWIDGNPVTYDGATRIKIEAYAELMEPANVNGAVVIVELYDGATDIGRFIQVSTPTAGFPDVTGYGQYFVTPSAGSHTYHAKAWREVANGTIYSSFGIPSFLRITHA